MDRSLKRRRIGCYYHIPTDIVQEIFSFLPPIDAFICSWTSIEWMWVWNVMRGDKYRNGFTIILLDACDRGNINIVQWIHGLDDLDMSKLITLEFDHACCGGNLHLVKWFFETYSIELENEVVPAFYSACDNGCLSVCKYLHGLNVITGKFAYEMGFCKACGGGHLMVAHWLYVFYKFTAYDVIGRALESSCINGKLTTSKWLYGLGIARIPSMVGCDIGISGSLVMTKWLYSICKSDCKLERLFSNACIRCDLDIAKWIHELIGFCGDNNDILRACEYDNLILAKWLYKIRYVDIITIKKCFSISCRCDKFDVSKWLYGLGRIHVSHDTDVLFRVSCFNGNIEMVKWFYEIGLFSSRVVDQHLFNGVCCAGFLLIAKFIYEIHKFDIHDSSFEVICQDGKLDMVLWFYEIGFNTDTDESLLVDRVFYSTCKVGHLAIAKLLYKRELIDISSVFNILIDDPNVSVRIKRWLRSL